MPRPLRVLISEDREDDALLVVDELRQSGYGVEWRRVETAEDMRSLLAAEPWDLIVADYDLPQFSAMGALAVVKESGHDIPFLIVSGAIRELDAVAGMRAGVHDYFLKNSLARLGPVVARELKEAEVRRERSLAEAMLRRQAQVLDQVQDAVIQTDLAGAIVKWNLGAQRVFGYTAAEAVGQPVAMLYFPEDCTAGEPAIYARLRTEGRVEGELRQRHRSGEVRWIRLSLSLLREENGEPYGVVGYAQDVTERRTAEEALRASEERYRLLTESLPQMIWVAREPTRPLRIEFCNQQVLTYTGATPEQLRQGHWQNLVHPEDLARINEIISQAQQACTGYEVQYRIQRASDQTWRWHLARSSPFQDVDGQVRWLATIIDMEDQVRADDALRKAEKLAAVGRLASSIAHEINNPLESVTNLLYLLQSTPLDPEQAEFLRLAGQELARVSHIATHTLRFHRQSSFPTEIDVTELLDSVLALYGGRLSGVGIQVVRDYRSSPPLLCYDGELRQVLANLIGNAFDATRQGGRIVVRVRGSREWRTGREGLRITVADTGHGMSQAVRERIFEPFFTTKGINGTGLGLWVSADIVEKHSGTLMLRSRDVPAPCGTVFSLFLPLKNHLLALQQQNDAPVSLANGISDSISDGINFVPALSPTLVETGARRRPRSATHPVYTPDVSK